MASSRRFSIQATLCQVAKSRYGRHLLGTHAELAPPLPISTRRETGGNLPMCTMYAEQDHIRARPSALLRHSNDLLCVPMLRNNLFQLISSELSSVMMVLLQAVVATGANFPKIFFRAFLQQGVLHYPLHFHSRVIEQRRARAATAQFFDVGEMLNPVFRAAHTQLCRFQHRS